MPVNPDVTVPVFGSTDELVFQILKEFFADQDVHIGTWFTEDIKPPMVICRRERRSGTLANVVTDDRFLQASVISINTITAGIDADEQGAELQEACRIALRQAQQKQTVIPNAGSISVITNSTPANQASDYATSTGVQQYASLPQGWIRWEALYRIIQRSPHQSTITNRFLTTPDP